MFSVVCVYNDKEIFNDHLLKSLEGQTVGFEQILIDNTSNAFTSASAALNYGGCEAKGKYILFVHQDIDLDSKTWLEDAERMLDTLPNVGIAGVAGCGECGIATIIKHGDPPRSPADILINEPTKVQTLDECLILVPGNVFRDLKFDEILCDSWHLYAVDFCLRCKLLGLEVYALPMSAYHRSSGSAGKNPLQIISSLSLYPNEYHFTLKKLLNKYKNYYKYIYTTCGVWNTSYPLAIQRYVRFVRYGPRYASDKIKCWISKTITCQYGKVW